MAPVKTPCGDIGHGGRRAHPEISNDRSRCIDLTKLPDWCGIDCQELLKSVSSQCAPKAVLVSCAERSATRKHLAISLNAAGLRSSEACYAPSHLWRTGSSGRRGHASPPEHDDPRDLLTSQPETTVSNLSCLLARCSGARRCGSRHVERSAPRLTRALPKPASRRCTLVVFVCVNGHEGEERTSENDGATACQRELIRTSETVSSSLLEPFTGLQRIGCRCPLFVRIWRQPTRSICDESRDAPAIFVGRPMKISRLPGIPARDRRRLMQRVEVNCARRGWCGRWNRSAVRKSLCAGFRATQDSRISRQIETSHEYGDVLTRP